jgi:ankyrin repeat protein
MTALVLMFWRCVRSTAFIFALSLFTFTGISRDIPARGDDQSASRPGTQPTNDSSKVTPVAWAAQDGDTTKVKDLLAQGASLADQSFGDKMTLLAAAASQGHADTVSLLLKMGLNPNIPDRIGNTAIDYAVLWGSLDTVSILLDAGANPNAPNIQGDASLQCVAMNGNMPIAKVLIAHGADPSTKDLFGRTPADSAREWGFADLAKYLDTSVRNVNTTQANR